ncbi:homeobox leucine zipper protein [Perilla frutescens var. hirtella]|uniref:Homeobox leucine zipper protein n=1 Tax=Perilla frutescens var. hirtella TaxID=608512 RepID=A0AAD4J5G9_PERFH|nr:homeobox leucine zipper protein [Perilla frutescens var. frutescens]KAH6793743.1 homeobox leucine zipper protein [Perilla frutescens var. hirtella]KAH6826980.1 homeobox leucine zipper protein [Perilla frutescens var. hirtella]
MGLPAAKGLDVNRMPAAEEVSSANSVGSPFHMYRNSGNGNLQVGGNKREFDGGGNENAEAERASSRASDDDENGLNTRKKLRLSKEQSAFLEESFKEHNTLNPKQKLALAKQLNLRPRQVEVWFQNRRARCLKQTEVDCEYLKRCCETLTEENRRLHKELQELRALKSSNPFYMQLPATTLTMCPSCERVATASTAAPPTVTVASTAADSIPKAIPFPLITRPRFYPFSQTPTHPNQPAAS